MAKLFDLTRSKTSSGAVACDARTGAFTVAAYVLSHGITALLITPLQERVVPEITVFASLVYLPHGVRVLSTWLCGWRAVLPLLIGSVIADFLFTPVEIRDLLHTVIIQSWLIGVLCAPLAFELLRRLGAPADPRALTWRWLLVAGIVASVINSLGQTYVFSGLMKASEVIPVVLLYALGDVVGLAVAALALMAIFRWMRVGFGR